MERVIEVRITDSKKAELLEKQIGNFLTNAFGLTNGLDFMVELVPDVDEVQTKKRK